MDEGASVVVVTPLFGGSDWLPLVEGVAYVPGGVVVISVVNGT